MLHDTPVTSRAAQMNAAYGPLEAPARIKRALQDAALGRLALVSSFGAQSVVLLHMVSRLDPALQVLFIDTEMLFQETLAYQTRLARDLGLVGVRLVRPDHRELSTVDPDATLHQRALDACCDLRKTRPLERALQGFDGWITGRKRFQGGVRSTLPLFEEDGAGRLKFNPLADWNAPQVEDYIKTHDLPRHPLVARGFQSIGCSPCTVAAPNRDGRWAGQDKEECGIHFIGGRATRQPRAAAPVIVTDAGFGAETWTQGFADTAALADAGGNAGALDLPSDGDVAGIAPHLGRIALIRVDFPDFSDGRGFTIARRLRRMGFSGRLRARGHLLADQYAMARRAGFDEVEISTELAARQPEDQWQARAIWRAHDYQSRLRG